MSDPTNPTADEAEDERPLGDDTFLDPDHKAPPGRDDGDDTFLPPPVD